ncbi:ankyrin repeat domain-containing protein [Legionella sainthelensi]|uniref:ankyrin repeat domain-containing protein n=1 Tax=Legionella sainthelensi TaxID=28087 RepID=UPI000E20A10D|nr:ankyrin repeat domain-containing protein [Legionella sainthelensi]
MQFFNESQRNQRPEARLIPKVIWDEIFYDELFPDSLIPWMNMTCEELQKQLFLIPEKEKDKAWMAIACSHPDMDNQQLINIGERFGFSVSDLLNLAVMLGDSAKHLALLKLLSQNEFYTDSILHGPLRFQRAAQLGHLNGLKYFIEMIQFKVSYRMLNEMIAKDNFYVFRAAAEHGHLDVLKYLEEKNPRQPLQEMIAKDNFYVFRTAAEHGHLDVLKYLVEKSHGQQLQEMIAAISFYAFRQAVTKKHLSVVLYLLNYPSVFAYAEIHQHEYDEQYVRSFIVEKLTVLRTHQQEAEANNSDAVFDVASSEEANFLFYIVRNMIRRNDATLIDDLRFLLNIPSVKALAHMEVTPNQSNELLRLALSVGNQEAASVLLNIPAVRMLAEQNNYYLHEQQGRIDLAALAADCESSMTALTQGERQQLQAVTHRYQPLLKQAGITQVMMDLRTTLQAHYESHPATITISKNGHREELMLPMTWNEFITLRLTPEQKAQALTAYYQNKAHTAWRYLSKPNPWIHDRASYVAVNENRTERWSTFEEYQPLISLLYLAAIDKDTPCIDEHTFATRLEHFIDELAHVGRAHNWDQSRRKDNGKIEQYDDLEGDRPSCFSGVKRRLFQSVLGHPLLKLVTEDVIKAEINEFLVTHFKKTINPNNCIIIKKAWDKGIEGELLNEEDMKAIQSLNVSLEQQKAFKNYLSQKYGSSFAINLNFINRVDKTFELTLTTSSHLFKHGSLMVEFFNKLQATKEDVGQSLYRFFAVSASNLQNSEAPSTSIIPKK